MAPRAHKKGLELAYQVARTYAVVRADPARLRQYVNMVHAVKFTEAGESSSA